MFGSSQKSTTNNYGLDSRYLERFHTKQAPFHEIGMAQSEAVDTFAKESQTIAGARDMPKKVEYKPFCHAICLKISPAAVLDMRRRLLDALAKLAVEVRCHGCP